MRYFRGGDKTASGDRSGLGKGFKGTIDYLIKGRRGDPNPDRVEWVAFRELDTEDPLSAARILRAQAQENPRVSRPVYHCGLSLPEGARLTREQWERAADRLLAGLGLSGHQAVFVAHRDSKCEHLHIVVNRVGPDTLAWNARRDGTKALAVVQELAREYGLPEAGRDRVRPPELSRGAVQESRRLGTPALVEQVRERGSEAFAGATSWRELEERLAAVGFRLERAERGSGLVVTDGARRVSVSHVDRSFSGPRLAARFGESFAEFRARSPEPPPVSPATGQAVARLEGETLSERAAELVARQTATRATYTEAQLARAAFHEPQSRELVRQALEAHSVPLGRDPAGALRYTSREYFEAERRLFSSAEALTSRSTAALEASAAESAMARSRVALSDEQRAAVVHATTGSDLAQILGRAGAGKTTAAEAIGEAYRSRGYEVVGLALAGRAAETLERETGIPSRTIASFLASVEAHPERLSSRSVVVVDEAGMVDSRQLGRVLGQAEAAGAKVVLLGDPAQLKPIGAGDAYRGLLELYPSAALETIRRQTEGWQREASAELAAGRVARALAVYEAAGRLEWSDTREEARSALVACYAADRAAAPEPSRLVLAYRNDDVRELNAALRSERVRAGELGTGWRVGNVEYAAGDRVVFLQNDHRGELVRAAAGDASGRGVKNGTLATLEAVGESRFVARLDDGRRVAWNPKEYESFAHGYAVTIHKSQGATVAQVYVLADPLMDRHGSYVALTRHREDVHLYADTKTFPHRDLFERALARPSEKDLARDYAAAHLERVAARLEPYEARLAELARERTELHRTLWRWNQERDTGEAREKAYKYLEQTAAQVYRDPVAATKALAADRDSAARLGRGEVERYGTLLGRSRVLLGPDEERKQALGLVGKLSRAVEAHEGYRATWEKARQALAGLPSRAELMRGLKNLGAAETRLRGWVEESKAVLKSLALAPNLAPVLSLASTVGRLALRAAITQLVRALEEPKQERGMRLGR